MPVKKEGGGSTPGRSRAKMSTKGLRKAAKRVAAGKMPVSKAVTKKLGKALYGKAGKGTVTRKDFKRAVRKVSK